MDSYQDKELLLQIASGDEKAFATLIDRHTASVYGHVLSYIKDPHYAEEITQDIFVAIWKNRDGLAAIEHFAAYLFKATRNKTISAFRQKLKAITVPVQDALDLAAEQPAETVEFQQLSETIIRGIELLPPRRQQVFKLSRLEGKTYDDIARQLNISRSSVNQHIVEALVFLRTYLRDAHLAYSLLGLLMSNHPG